MRRNRRARGPRESPIPKTDAAPAPAGIAPPERESDALLARLAALHPRVIDLSLDRIRRLMARLGDPQLALPPVVHIAGTNGKGSTLAFMAAMLAAAGYRVHALTSPHLVRFHERIRLAGATISEARLTTVLRECETANRGAPITFFEITTAAAFLAFARTPADVLLLEVGLGGRLDATNLVAAPALTMITPVSCDHQGYLGETVADIAAEKAGILKPEVPALIARQPAAARTVIARRARALGAPLGGHGDGWRVSATTDEFRVTGRDPTGRAWCHDVPRPGLVGDHQIDNAGLAVAGIEALAGFAVDHDAIARGITAVRWPARLQHLDRGALAEALPAGWELWLDGGHNPAAGAALARMAARWTADGTPLHLVFGMLDSKPPADFLRPLAPHVSHVCTVPVPDSAAALSPEAAAAAARAVGLAAAPAGDVATALRALCTTGDPDRPARVLICGSLYLAGAVLRDNGAAV